MEKLEPLCTASGNVKLMIKIGISKQLERGQLIQQMGMDGVERDPILFHIL